VLGCCILLNLSFHLIFNIIGSSSARFVLKKIYARKHNLSTYIWLLSLEIVCPRTKMRPLTSPPLISFMYSLYNREVKYETNTFR
jgi:hypothetical protein